MVSTRGTHAPGPAVCWSVFTFLLRKSQLLSLASATLTAFRYAPLELQIISQPTASFLTRRIMRSKRIVFMDFIHRPVSQDQKKKKN
jgi:hypothetical protein